MRDITAARFRSWYAGTNAATPTQRARIYALFKSIMKAAVDNNVIAASPCQIPQAAHPK